MERSRILGAGVWTAVGLAAALAVVGATSNRHCATATRANAAVAQAPGCCAQDVKATPTVAAVAPRAAKSTTVATLAARTSVGANGMVIAIDQESGTLGMPSAGQMQQLEAAQMLVPGDELNYSSVGLTPVHHADGSISVNLQGRFQEFATVHVDANGKKAFGCTSDPKSVVDPTNPNSPPSGFEEK